MRACGLLLCGVLAGCSESVSEVVAKNRAPVEATFAALKALSLPDAAPPPLEPPRAAVPIRLEGGADTNAMFIYAEDLAKPGAVAAVRLRSLDSLPLLQCGGLLEAGKLVDTPLPPKPSVVKQYLDACGRVRFALVIREREYVPPGPPPDGSRQFTPGSYRAEVLVFDVTTRALLGGYTFTAVNDVDVQVPEGTPTQQQLVTNLEGKAFTALRAATKAAVPGALP